MNKIKMNSIRRCKLLQALIIGGVISILLVACDDLLAGVDKPLERPNIVFFLVDDLGYSDVGCYGSDYYETPHIDQLAEDGTRFTAAYSASTICSPTRASILTGKYPGRLRITGAIPILGYMRVNDGKGTAFKDADYVMNLPLEEVTIAEALKSAGYATASVGKWHVSDDEKFFPEYQGFDLNVGGNGHGHTENYFYPYHSRWRMSKTSPWIEWNTLPDGVPNEYLTDRLTEEATDFIDKNKDRPFFLYLSHYAVHTPIQAKQAIQTKYENKPIDSVKGHFHAGYAAMIESVDESLGAVRAKLEELGLSDNTIIIFTSDNGGNKNVTSNYPLRGHKGNFYEGGIRVPLIISWPGEKTPTVIKTPVISSDFYPTMLDMAQLPLMPSQHVDGKSLKGLLTGTELLDREALYWHFPHIKDPVGAVRFGDWKLIESLEDGVSELYNLKNDERETINCVKTNRKVAVQLREMLADWRAEVNAQMLELNPNYIP